MLCITLPPPDLLNIPKSKKLLRKHLRIKFRELLTKDQASSKERLYSKDILSHNTKFKPRRIQQILLAQLPKQHQCDIGLSTHVCPRRITSHPNSTTLPRPPLKAPQRQMHSQSIGSATGQSTFSLATGRPQSFSNGNVEGVSVLTAPTVRENGEPSEHHSHVSEHSNTAPSGRVMGGMASLQCS